MRFPDFDLITVQRSPHTSLLSNSLISLTPINRDFIIDQVLARVVLQVMTGYEVGR